jgi:hypothetical protein
VNVKAVIVAIIALLSVACAPEQTLDRVDTLHVSAADAEAYPEALTAAMYGLDAWREDTGGVIDIRLVIGGEGPHRLKFRDTDLFGCEVPRDRSAGCAETGTDGVTITLATRWPLGVIARVMMHETGHGLGLDHAHAGLMCEALSPDPKAPAYIDSDTAAAAYAKFGVSIATDGMGPAWACPQ